MKKIIRLAVILALFITSYSYSQSVVTKTVSYGGFLACGGCAVCGGDYYCFNTAGSYCGNTPPCGTQSFFDPVPPGNLVTNVQLSYYSGSCFGNSLSSTINGNAIPAVNEGNTGCPCSASPCGISASSSGNFPCGMPNYVYGGNNTLQLCTGLSVCINKIVLTITYYQPSQVTPVITPNGPLNFCTGGSVTLDAGPGFSSYSWNTGATSQAITVSTSGTYVVNATSPSGCTTGSAAATVNVSPYPTVSVSASTTNICAGQSTTLNSSVNPTGGTYNWTPGNLGGSSVVVSPGATTTYNLAYTSPAGCLSNAPITINVSPSPGVSVSATPANICLGQSSTLNSSVNPAGGTYNWSPGGSTSPSFVASPGSTTTYNLVYTSPAGCTGSASTPVNVNPNPVVSISPVSSTICSGQSTTLNGVVNITGGAYNWMPGNLSSSNIVVSPASTQVYNLSYTTTSGCTGTATGTVVVAPNPALSVSVANPTICSGSSTVLSSTVSPGGGTYNWMPGGLTTANITVSPPSSQNYSLLYTAPGGCTATASASVQVKSPTVTVNNAVICAGLSTTLNSTVNPSAGTYTWMPGGQSTPNIVVSPSSTTNYTVNYASPDGCVNKAISTVSVNSGPIISINNATICPGASAVLSSTVNPTGGNYTWTPGGQNNPSIAVSPASTTIYTLNYVSTAGCAGTATAQVIVSATPTLSVNNATICSGSGASAALVATVIPAGGTFSWNPTGSTTSSIVVMPSVTTTYTLNYVSNAGCTASNISTVSVLTGFSSADFLYPANVCLDNQPVALTGTVAGGGTNSYQWFLGSGSTPSTAITQTVSVGYTFSGIKTVTLVVTNSFGCTDTVVHPININPLPILNFATAATCIGSSTSFTNSSWIGGSGVIASWLWDFGNGTTSGAFQPVVTYTAPGTYTVMLVANSDYGCDDTLYKTVTIYPTTIPGSVQSNTTVCASSNSATLSLNGNNGSVMFWQYSTNGGINWTPLSNTSTAQTYSNLNQTTIYQAYVQSGNCSGAFSNASTITVNSASDGGILRKDTVVCSTSNSGTLSLASYTGAVTDWIFSSNNGQTWSSLSNTLSVYSFSNLATSGLYSAIVKNGICPADTSNKVKVNVLFFQAATLKPYPDTTISIGYSLQIVAGGGVQYAWAPNYNISDTTVFNPNVWPTKNTTYTVIVQNGFGCRDVTQVTVFVKNDYKLIIANTVTPNNDGVNDTWWIGNLENYPNNEVMILNRYGQLLYETKGYKNTWDGMYNGQRLPDGTYFFVLKFPESNVIYKGSINIISSR
ncbi:MAG: gliding motility-associated C-terminal domain-containing protein [Bacteroidetes bacterium]|nr:gliding motility-associated C-terminal domain-containing protein [Bacteroidota bacterium]